MCHEIFAPHPVALAPVSYLSSCTWTFWRQALAPGHFGASSIYLAQNQHSTQQVKLQRRQKQVWAREAPSEVSLFKVGLE